MIKRLFNSFVGILIITLLLFAVIRFFSLSNLGYDVNNNHFIGNGSTLDTFLTSRNFIDIIKKAPNIPIDDTRILFENIGNLFSGIDKFSSGFFLTLFLPFIPVVILLVPVEFLINLLYYFLSVVYFILLSNNTTFDISYTHFTLNIIKFISNII